MGGRKKHSLGTFESTSQEKIMEGDPIGWEYSQCCLLLQGVQIVGAYGVLRLCLEEPQHELLQGNPALIRSLLRILQEQQQQLTASSNSTRRRVRSSLKKRCTTTNIYLCLLVSLPLFLFSESRQGRAVLNSCRVGDALVQFLKEVGAATAAAAKCGGASFAPGTGSCAVAAAPAAPAAAARHSGRGLAATSAARQWSCTAARVLYRATAHGSCVSAFTLGVACNRPNWASRVVAAAGSSAATAEALPELCGLLANCAAVLQMHQLLQDGLLQMLLRWGITAIQTINARSEHVSLHVRGESRHWCI
ncbi:uncharacterized protein LOC113147048 [Cyclospora cayetanensis]|uniref:Uncharacterized protein LOC113147048 n=1 Tax=Cyclospora cayetanensis TaxID=88456 RepID=A0A6P6RY10_9EIME|nr:uncharacterized protein LOC113147048 [Cyclospora cayetanensis]